MHLEHTINAWRDDEFRESLDEHTRAGLLSNPIGEIDLSDTDLERVAGGDAITASGACWSISILTILCLSIIYGGTCENDTTGCCDAELS